MKIGIVGGSITGCIAAGMLLKEGHEVSVFERSKSTLTGRGGGIGTTPLILNQIMEDGLISKNFPSLKIDKMPFVVKNKSQEPFGKKVWVKKISLKVFHWNDLWKQLRKNIPNEFYHNNATITHAELLENGKVELTINKKATKCFDLVLFADGYKSMGRKLLFPEKKVTYKGYVLWRGMLPESEVEYDVDQIKEKLFRFYSNKTLGHSFLYFIPNQNGSLKKKKRILNWGVYIPVSNEELELLMIDNSGNKQCGYLPFNAMRKASKTNFKTYVASYLPTHYSTIINQTNKSAVQAIYTIDVDSYYKSKMCLIGDAGIITQPFTGSGVFKGYHNVRDLVACINTQPTIECALKRWNKKQIEIGKNLLTLGEQMEKIFIWNKPNLTEVTEDIVANWWNNAVNEKFIEQMHK